MASLRPERRGLAVWLFRRSRAIAALNVTPVAFALALDGGFVTSFVVGGVFGALAWLPALAATLICFGLPLLLARRSARKGLAGEEIGEILVGGVCVLASAVGLGLQPVHWAAPSDVWFLRALGMVGVVGGGVAATLAAARERWRHFFVHRVEAGRIAGYRLGEGGG
jgi:hypothetical protein